MINIRFIIITIVLVNMVFCSVYNTGQTISIAHQNISFSPCYGENSQSELKLSDFNGDLNGGEYKVIWIDMAATW